MAAVTGIQVPTVVEWEAFRRGCVAPAPGPQDAVLTPPPSPTRPDAPTDKPSSSTSKSSSIGVPRLLYRPFDSVLKEFMPKEAPKNGIWNLPFGQLKHCIQDEAVKQRFIRGLDALKFAPNGAPLLPVGVASTRPDGMVTKERSLSVTSVTAPAESVPAGDPPHYTVYEVPLLLKHPAPLAPSHILCLRTSPDDKNAVYSGIHWQHMVINFARLPPRFWYKTSQEPFHIELVEAIIPSPATWFIFRDWIYNPSWTRLMSSFFPGLPTIPRRISFDVAEVISMTLAIKVPAPVFYWMAQRIHGAYRNAWDLALRDLELWHGIAVAWTLAIRALEIRAQRNGVALTILQN